jgi:hypothetical protein
MNKVVFRMNENADELLKEASAFNAMDFMVTAGERTEENGQILVDESDQKKSLPAIHPAASGTTKLKALDSKKAKAPTLFYARGLPPENIQLGHHSQKKLNNMIKGKQNDASLQERISRPISSKLKSTIHAPKSEISVDPMADVNNKLMRTNTDGGSKASSKGDLAEFMNDSFPDPPVDLPPMVFVNSPAPDDSIPFVYSPDEPSSAHQTINSEHR